MERKSATCPQRPEHSRAIARRVKERRERTKRVVARPSKSAVVKTSGSVRHMKPAVDVSEESEDECLSSPLREPLTSQGAVCEIVDVVSRDLSPPQSDLSPHWSGSEIGPDVSALAEEIVSEVMGTLRERNEDHHKSKSHDDAAMESASNGQTAESKGKSRSVVGKTVRFSLGASHSSTEQLRLAAAGEGEEGETGGGEGGGGGGEERDEEAVDVALTPQNWQLTGNEAEETVQEDGSRVTVCSNGTRKIVSSDGLSVTLKFLNGDTKHIRPDNTVVHYNYA